MTTIRILRGVSGSGKSTLAASMPRATVVSADDFFIVDGEYRFDMTKIGDAHGSCFRRAIEALQAGKDVVIDNTNCSLVEVAPYVLMGQAYGAEIEIHRIDCDVEIAKARNSHGVPPEAIEAMAAALAEPLPPWYPEEVVHKAG